MKPGKAGTIESRDLSTIRMRDREGKPPRVIDLGRVLFYVGTGWIYERQATEADADKFPVVVYAGLK